MNPLAATASLKIHATNTQNSGTLPSALTLQTLDTWCSLSALWLVTSKAFAESLLLMKSSVFLTNQWFPQSVLWFSSPSSTSKTRTPWPSHPTWTPKIPCSNLTSTRPGVSPKVPQHSCPPESMLRSTPWTTWWFSSNRFLTSLILSSSLTLTALSLTSGNPTAPRTFQASMLPALMPQPLLPPRSIPLTYTITSITPTKNLELCLVASGVTLKFTTVPTSLPCQTETNSTYNVSKTWASTLSSTTHGCTDLNPRLVPFVSELLARLW